MADEPLFSFDDDEPPAVLGKMYALIARHRGNGPDPSVPVLTDLAATSAPGEIPVLTHVEPVLGDDLMFTPEEIRPDDFAPPAPPPAAAPARQQALAAPTPASTAPVIEDLIAVPPLASPRPVTAPAPAVAPVAPPVTARAAPPAPPTDFDFPDLVIPTAKPAAAKPAPAAPTAPVPAGPLMPELSLNFDFPPPAEEKPKAAPVPAPSPTVMAAPIAAPVRAPSPPPERAFPVEESIEISLDDDEDGEAESEVIDPDALAKALLATLQPAMEKLVRSELARQSAALHVEVLKRTLGAIQPQLHALIAAEVEAALKRK